jgi:Trypsin-like peptidase domain
MPAIPPEILDTVVYLYPDADSASRGERAGGSGCLVVLPTQTEPFVVGFMYVVTNSHVIREGKVSAIRLNTRDGGMGIIHGTENGWIHHPDGDDLAVLSVNLEYEQIKARGISPDWFATKEKIARFKIGPGDEAFMVGRFVNHEGKQRNLPAIRFGNVSMLPHEPVRTGRGLLQEVFLVECRSLPGYSGSPVFVYPLPSSPIPRATVPLMFLGIDMGHLTDKLPVLDGEEFLRGNRVYKDGIVEANTGMSCVIPAWKVYELLHVEELVESRKEILKALEAEQNASVRPVEE